jgi:hypothetical protein
VRCQVSLRRDDQPVGVARCLPGQIEVRFSELESHRVYTVTAAPELFARSARFVSLQDSDGDETLLCLATAQHAAPKTVPLYADLPRELCQVLERSEELDLGKQARDLAEREIESRSLSSRVVGEERQTAQRLERQVRSGQARWDRLGVESKAGLLNLFAKMCSVTVSAQQRTVWSYVDALSEVARDRVKARIIPVLVDAVAAAPAIFRDATELIPIFHSPPENFRRAGSWKTIEPFGNLQLTFFRSSEDPSAMRVDADVDDAAGIEHGEQVIKNESRGLLKKVFGSVIPGLPEGVSHPYDIHQLVMFNQKPMTALVGGIGKYVPCYHLAVDGIPPPYEI